MEFFCKKPRFQRSEVVYSPSGRFGPRLQYDLQLVYLFEGEALISIDGQTEYLGAGEATLLLPGREELFLFSRSRKTWHGWCAVLQPVLSIELFQKLDALPFRNVMSERMREIDALAAAVDPSNQGLFGSLIQAVFYEFLSISGFDMAGEEALPFHPTVRKAHEYIENHSSDPLTLGAIARRCNVSDAHLIRLFKAEMDVTPMEFLWECRVRAAARLLADTGLSSAEVAYRTGFATAAHFSRRFKQRMKMTPGQYRRQIWGV